jgi:hypothetical protein
VTNKALDNAEEILEFELDSGNVFTFAPTLRAKTSIIGTVLATQAKVDETRLRRQTLDRLPSLLKLVNETAERLPQIIEG